jgi:hypothetical protein
VRDRNRAKQEARPPIRHFRKEDADSEQEEAESEQEEAESEQEDAESEQEDTESVAGPLQRLYSDRP